MKKLPEITISDWIEAEKSLTHSAPQPKGSITVDQYAEMRGISKTHSSHILKNLLDDGMVKRDTWSNSSGNKCWVYWLNK